MNGNYHAIFDMYNKRCFVDLEAATSGSPNNAVIEGKARYVFDYIERKHKYVCDCEHLGSFEYHDAKDPTNDGEDDVDNAYLVFGHKQEKWMCDVNEDLNEDPVLDSDVEVLKVDLVANVCYKGQHEYIYDADRAWCGPIPLFISQFEIIKWNWSSDDGAGNITPIYLIDLFHMTCKDYDETTK